MFVLWLLLGFSFGCARDLCRCSEIVDFVMHVQWSCNACAIVLVVLHYTLCAGFAKQPHIAQLLHNYCMTIADLLHNHFVCLAFVQQLCNGCALIVQSNTYRGSLHFLIIIREVLILTLSIYMS